ncbi:hypothetical protein NOF55_20880 [Rhizobiaceae bacterium BDR2-2]|uniref:Uncharacterized protein n=1 Tax=Ectorhizobium quercum TaxID=2965071 RepID=A0AAE3SXX4_9HYPH|nr:hypothetical protein [Ectorhizobium quercum]MCX8999564.1 hypothetical protein [Ectorhizobium quercum]
MFENLMMTSAFAWAGAGIWLVISVLRIVIPKWRRSAIRQAKWSSGLFVLTFVAAIVFNQMIYRDYGLSSSESLAEARAARKVEAEAKVVEENRKKEQAEIAQKEAEAKAAVERTRLLAEADQQTKLRKEAEELAAAEAKRCGIGTIVAVSSSYKLRKNPRETSDKIVNQKATEALRKTHYHQIDNSTSVKIMGCSAEWTQVQIAEPSWLTDVSGWVPSKVLRRIETSSDGARVYVESDVYWDNDTSKFKKQIVTMINKISRENAGCKQIDPGTVAKSTSRSKPNEPVFFVTCGEGSNAFNVWFRPTDITTTMTATPPIRQGDATLACEQAAKAKATHPSTVDFSRFLDVAYSARPDGRVSLTSSFLAKNSFNLELKFNIRCLFDGNTMIEATVSEAR